ncbi:endo-1,4-beta-xylanase 4-like [Macadamia integrifolia]|uniref:endo-1,4-beta-xylanase 4-like n=1 Tax=Macadamia integrifolia TaxID=60698 RepID=UPI001C52E753|nr:endo-1,4-beta-xylanase 4-like [Macadamia integrifolia]
MKTSMVVEILLLLCSLVWAGNEIDASIYDYSASILCLGEAQKPQYGGGLILNPEFSDGLQGWTVFGHGNIELRTSTQGNQFIVAYNRTNPQDSFSQMIYLKEGIFYTFSAWVQIKGGSNTMVVAALKISQDQNMVVGAVVAQYGCWSMLKGGLSVNFSGPTELYFESRNIVIEIWADNVSLQPFSKDQWQKQQTDSIEKIRKRKVRFHVSDKEGKMIHSATVSMESLRPQFPLGCGTSEAILSNKDYQDWFTSRFTATTFDNEMKWYSTEINRGKENYSIPDAMVTFFKEHRISIRGHNIFWDDPRFQPKWLKSLPPEELKVAALNRLHSVVSRYSGQLIAWDVMNENLHFSYFEDKLGPYASAYFFYKVQQLDPRTDLFMNEYNTLENAKDLNATPAMYLQKLREIRSFATNKGMLASIGLESHFDEPDIPYMRACLDTLGATQLPIWLTELDVTRGPNQARYLEEIMREAYSHPSVQGIIVWAGWKPTGCSRMCLTDNSFKNLPTGDVVDKLIQEWSTNVLQGTTDINGIYEHSVFLGEYLVTVTNAQNTTSLKQTLEVTREQSEALDVLIAI